MEAKALGKGLSALISNQKNVQSDDEQASVLNINVQSIDNNSLQPRVDYNDEKLEELKNSIKENGILQPILVRRKADRYEVIAGERRLRAARALSLEKIPAVIRDVSDKEVLVFALIENIQREELNPIEEAEAFRKLIEEFGYTQQEVAASVGKDRSTISNILRLLNLPSRIKRAIELSQLSVGHARTLLSFENPIQRDHAFDLILKNGLSVREAENLVKKSAEFVAKKIRKVENKPLQIVQLEETLQKMMGTKVQITLKKKRGAIVIDYYSISDLQRIVKIIGASHLNKEG